MASHECARGALVVIEGLDRSGKTTQCQRLITFLEGRGHRVVHKRFPDRTTAIGELIDKYLRGEVEQDDHVIHLLFSANRWEAARLIEDNLAAGMTIVVDRYYYSGCVYSAAKNVPGLDLRWARCPEVGLPQPDVCIFLDISPEEAAKRGGYGQERYEKKQLQDKVRQLFHELRELDASEPFRLVDAGRSASLVERDVCANVLDCLERVAREDPRTALRRVRPLNAQDLSSDLVSCDRAKDLSPSQRSNAAGNTGNSDEGPISPTDHE